MTITPRPDADSRFPIMYCKTCGGGWLTFTRCDRDQWKGDDTGPHCDFTGECEAPVTNADCFAMCWTKDNCRWTGCKKLQTITVRNESGTIIDPPNRCPDCGEEHACKPGCPSRIESNSSSVGSTGTDWSKLEPPK